MTAEEIQQLIETGWTIYPLDWDNIPDYPELKPEG